MARIRISHVLVTSAIVGSLLQLAARAQSRRGLVQARDDPIVHPLLPISDGVATRWRRLGGILHGTRLLKRGLKQERGEKRSEHCDRIKVW